MKHMTKEQLLKVEKLGGKVHRMEPKKPAPDHTRMLAEKAIASMKDALNHNDHVYSEIVKLMTHRPIRFDIHRDNMGNMVSVIPIYEVLK